MSKKTEGPSKRDIENFLYKVAPKCTEKGPDYGVYESLSDEVRRLEEEFRDSSKMRRLIAKRDAAWDKYDAKRREINNTITELAIEYRTKGLCPNVLKKIQDFADKINKEILR